MDNANEPAFPSLADGPWGKPYMSGGLTKRELFVAIVAQGAGGYEVADAKRFATYCVGIADALLAELDSGRE